MLTCCAEMDSLRTVTVLRLPRGTLLVITGYLVFACSSVRTGLRAFPSLSLWMASCGDGYFDVLAAYGAVLVRFKGSVVQGPVPTRCSDKNSWWFMRPSLCNVRCPSPDSAPLLGCGSSWS